MGSIKVFTNLNLESTIPHSTPNISPECQRNLTSSNPTLLAQNKLKKYSSQRHMKINQQVSQSFTELSKRYSTILPRPSGNLAPIYEDRRTDNPCGKGGGAPAVERLLFYFYFSPFDVCYIHLPMGESNSLPFL